MAPKSKKPVSWKTKHDVRVKTSDGKVTRATLKQHQYERYQEYRKKGATQQELSSFVGLHSTESVAKMHRSMVTKAMSTLMESKLPNDNRLKEQWESITAGMSDKEIEELGKGIIGKFKTARDWAYKHDMTDENQVLKAQEKVQDIIGYAKLYRERLDAGLKPAKARTAAKRMWREGL